MAWEGYFVMEVLTAAYLLLDAYSFFRKIPEKPCSMPNPTFEEDAAGNMHE